MNNWLQRALISSVIFIAILLAFALQQPFAVPSHAQGEPTPSPNAESKPPFQLPFADPPGPNTWLMAQPYGNTTGAYFQRNTLYRASGGIHFGLDLAQETRQPILCCPIWYCALPRELRSRNASSKAKAKSPNDSCAAAARSAIENQL